MSWQRYVFKTMGTIGNLFYEESQLRDGPQASVHDILETYENHFSLYQQDSEISRVNRGELHMTDTSELFRHAYTVSMACYRATDALFTPYPATGILDLNGVAKAMAVEAIGDELKKQGYANWSLNIGGDILVAGHDEQAGTWRIGIIDPNSNAKAVATVSLAEPMRAIATSGSSERGSHIWGIAHRSLRQATVISETLLEADMLATTAIAAGDVNSANAALARRHIGSLLFEEDGQSYANTTMRDALKTP